MRAVQILPFLALFYFDLFYAQPCPNQCNNNGRCVLPGRQCECFDGYTGADCSLRTCYYGRCIIVSISCTDPIIDHH